MSDTVYGTARGRLKWIELTDTVYFIALDGRVEVRPHETVDYKGNPLPWAEFVAQQDAALRDFKID